jgi:hypothetical protein
MGIANSTHPTISFPANAGSIFLAGQVVRLNVYVGRETLREFDGERVANLRSQLLNWS